MFFQTLPKPLLFGFFGAFGCLLGAILGEGALTILLPSSQRQSIDTLFVLDITGSMRNEIDGIKNGIKNFVLTLGNRDVRVGLITFGDECIGEETKVLLVNNDVFTHDTVDFSRAVERISLLPGGDPPESSLNALVLGSQQSFSSHANKVMVLITDAPPHALGDEFDCSNISGNHPPSVQNTIDSLNRSSINQLHLVTVAESLPYYSKLHSAVPGEIFTLDSNGRQDFAILLPSIGRSIASAISTDSIDTAHANILLLATAIWTSLLALGIFILLIGGQNFYLRRTLLAPTSSKLISIFGVVLCGFVAGGFTQWLASHLEDSTSLSIWARITAWSLLGAIISRGIAFFIPNLNIKRVLLGGILGGALGALGFVLSTEIGIGDTFGRLTGATILGFLIGLMIPIIEMVSRQFWLEISYGPKEIRTINLGIEPVSFGSNTTFSSIYANVAEARAFVYQIEQGKVVCEDLVSGKRETLSTGHHRQIGNLNVTVRETGIPKNASPLVLRLSASQQHSLTLGKVFLANEIPGLEPSLAGNGVAEVNQNPNNPSILGLKNLSLQTWEVTLPNELPKQLRPLQSIKLVEGSRISFNGTRGTIIVGSKD